MQRAAIAEKLQMALLPAMRNHGIDMVDRAGLGRTTQSRSMSSSEAGSPVFAPRSSSSTNGSETPEKIYFGSHEQPANSVIQPGLRRDDLLRIQSGGPDTSSSQGGSRPQSARNRCQHLPTPCPKRMALRSASRTFSLKPSGPNTPAASSRPSSSCAISGSTAHRKRLRSTLSCWSGPRGGCPTALSKRNIVTGVTTAEDVAWWLEDRALELGLTGGGTVRVVREGELLPIHDPNIPLEPGDVLSIDGGLNYLGYAIDIKRAAYILRPGETSMPESMQKAWETTHEIGDLYAGMMLPGAIGFETWSAINAEVERRGYKAVGPDAGGDAVTTSEPELGVYGHSVGNVAHDIGARIAADIPFAYGDRVRFPLIANEWVSIEFHVSTPIPEWDGKTWYARFEETAQVTDRGYQVAHPDSEGVAADQAGELMHGSESMGIPWATTLTTSGRESVRIFPSPTENARTSLSWKGSSFPWSST